MTNGDKIKEIFPNGVLTSGGNNSYYWGNDILVSKEHWNAEYKEPKCQWIKYDYRTVCPKEHDIDNPYWRIPENRMETLKYCPYCGKEIEVEE